MANVAKEETVTTTASAEETLAAEGTETGSHEEATEGGPAAILGTFGLRGDLFAAQLVNFLLVLLVLWKFAYKPIMKMLEEREQKIAKSVADAEAIEQRMKEFTAEREAMMNAARKEAQDIIVTAMTQSDERKAEMIDAAKREVERVIAKGKQQLIQDKEAMLHEVRKDMVDIAVKAAARIIHEGLDPKKSQSLAEEVVRKMT